jgi:hypothetical protein
MNLVRNRIRKILGVSLMLLALNCSSLFTSDYDVCYVAFEVLRTLVMKSSVFCDITLCSPLIGKRRFGGIYHLPFSVSKNKLNKKLL